MKKLFEYYNIVLEGFSNYKDMLDMVMYHCRGKLLSLKGQNIHEKGVKGNGYRRRTIINIEEGMDITIFFYPYLRRLQSFADPINRVLHIGILELISHNGKDYRHFIDKKAMNALNAQIMAMPEKKRPRMFPIEAVLTTDFVENATIKPTERPKTFNNILAAAAHEITHISQIKHGGMRWDIGRNKKEFDELPKNLRKRYGNDRAYYAGKTHMKSKMEHEARLIEYFVHIKRKSYQSAFKLFMGNYTYLGAFDKRKFLNTMVENGISMTEYRRYTDSIFENLKKGYNTYKNGYDFYKQNVKDFFSPTIVNYFKSFSMEYIHKYFKNLYFEEGFERRKKLTLQLEKGFEAIG